MGSGLLLGHCLYGTVAQGGFKQLTDASTIDEQAEWVYS